MIGNISVFAVVTGAAFFLAASTALGFGGSTDSDTKEAFARVEKAMEAERYEQAIPLLNEILKRDARNADAFNYLGYTHRKLGNYEEAKKHYLEALKIDPEHKGANEYLGELYLETGDLPAAQERLRVLDDACGFFGCEEYDELEEKIEAYKKAKGVS